MHFCSVSMLEIFRLPITYNLNIDISSTSSNFLFSTICDKLKKCRPILHIFETEID